MAVKLIEDRRFYVYAYLDPREKRPYKYGDFLFFYKPFYIGKGCGDRYIEHIRESDKLKKETNCKCTNKHKINKINSIYKDGAGLPIIMFIEHNLTSPEACDLEKRIIENIGLDHLTNMTEGGDGVSGYTITPEYRKKLSIAQKGRKITWTDKIVATRRQNDSYKTSEETRKSISSSIKALWRDEEYRKQMTDSHKGFKQSDETKNKRRKIMSDLRWVNNGKECKRIPSGELHTYIERGWETGKGKIWVNNGKISKQIFIDDLLNEDNKGFKKGVLKNNE